MTLKKGVALVFALAAAGATGSSTVPSARLTSISTRADSRGASLIVEATEPVAYVATRPDPLTVVLEFRNVDAQTVSKKLANAAKTGIADVTIDNGDSL